MHGRGVKKAIGWCLNVPYVCVCVCVCVFMALSVKVLPINVWAHVKDPPVTLLHTWTNVGIFEKAERTKTATQFYQSEPNFQKGEGDRPPPTLIGVFHPINSRLQ